MKSFGKILVLSSTFLSLAALAAGQTNLQNYVQHVIVIIQENRTPDTLFNQDAVLAANGAHMQPSFPPRAARAVSSISRYSPPICTSAGT